MIERDHGAEVARSVARKMVVYQRRAGGQSQFSALLDLEPKTDRVQKALTYARLNLQKDLSVEALVDVAGLSPRQFRRAFHEETSQSPAKAIEHLRVEAARLMLEEGQKADAAILHSQHRPSADLRPAERLTDRRRSDVRSAGFGSFAGRNLERTWVR